MTLRPVLAAALCTLAANVSLAADLPPADKPAEQVIDQLIDAQIAAANATPAAQVDDAAFIRRATLDLVGRIPTLAEVNAYVNSSDPDKRAKLIDRLLASPGFPRHQAAMFDAMLNPDGDRRGGTGLRDYLTAALRENRSWEQMFREILLPDEADPKTKGAADFLKARLADADRLTVDVSVSFFGVNVSCAQCHDHPLVKDWTQDHFYGMKSFLARTYDASGFLAERPAGLVKFKPNKGPEKTAKLMFLTGTEVPTDTLREPTKEEQQAEKQAMEKVRTIKAAPPKPAFSARAQLVEVALQKGNSDFFSRAIVNRLWHRFLGRGLVNPLDQMHSENPPSHPELIAWLARDTAEHGYDLKRLIRGLVMSKAYSRSSRYETESVPPVTLFAVARLKPLTPMQLSLSLRIAATDPAQFEGKPDDVEKKIEQMEGGARGFASLIAQPNDNFQIGVGEALLFSNGDRVMKEFLTDGGGTLLGRVNAEKDTAAAIDLMVRVVYGRPPSAAESKAFAAYVEKRSDRKPEAYRQLLWVLVTGPEFRFNY
jgi:hypothetical protein